MDDCELGPDRDRFPDVPCGDARAYHFSARPPGTAGDVGDAAIGWRPRDIKAKGATLTLTPPAAPTPNCWPTAAIRYAPAGMVIFTTRSDAIGKRNSGNVPYCISNEMICARIGRFLGIP